MPKNAPNQSVNRTVLILFAVAGSEDGRTIGQIAEALDIKPNTAYRFIRTLEQERLLSRKERPLRFLLGPTLTELKRLDDDRHLLTVASKVLKRTSAKMPEGNFALLEQDGLSTWQRLCVESTRPGILIRRRSFQIGTYAKASSLLFLAYSSPNDANAFYRAHPFEKEGKTFWATKQQLEDFLAKVRHLGYSSPGCDDDASNIAYRLAYPIFSKGQEPIAALAAYLTGIASKDLKKQLHASCREAATEIQEAIQ